MPSDEPGAPRSAPLDTGQTATFRAGAEAADPTEVQPGAPPRRRPPVPSTTGGPGGGAPPRHNAPPRRRFLDDPDPDVPKEPRRPKVRARKVRRIVRHVEPWSVLKISVLFFLSIFLIICVASAVLWNAGRSAGVIDDVESFVTSLGFGNCEDLEGEQAPPTTTVTIDQSQPQLGASTTVPTGADEPTSQSSTIPDDDGKCAEGQVLVGGFKFEDQRIFQSFALGGIVLVLSGAAASVVMAVLFNLISDLTGGVRVTVLEEDPLPRRTGSPPPTTGD